MIRTGYDYPYLANDYNAQLLGYSFSDFTRQTKNLTHQVLNAGASVPITSGAVSAIRNVASWFTTAKSANDDANSAIDAAAAAIKANKIKTALIVTGVGGIGLYFLLRKKRA